MRRDITSLKADKFDVLVVGAGIHGACVARDAALRGLRVAIIDKGDFGSATSHNSLKTIHGGIRYLQQFNIKRTVQSIREQAIFLKIAPHLVNRLDFLMPLYGWGLRGPLAMWMALNFFYLLCRWQRSPVSRGRVLSAATVRNEFPDFSSQGLTGGARWPEVQISYADRAVVEMLEEVYCNTGVVANYVEAKSISVANGSVSQVELIDTLNSERFSVTADVVVNAAGPWVSDIAASISTPNTSGISLPLTKSMNLVLKNQISNLALGVSSQSSSDAKIGNNKRLFFIVPWNEHCIAGTTHFPHREEDRNSTASKSEINEFLSDLNQALPNRKFSEDDVLYAYHGLTPSVAEGESVKRPEHSTVINHKETDGVANLFSIVGIKWTTARLVAEETVNLVCKALEVQEPCATRDRPIPALKAVGTSTVGLDTSGLEKFCKDHIEHTQAQDLADIVLRRTDDLVCNRMNTATLTEITSIVARELGWSNEQLLNAVDRLSLSGLPAEKVSALKAALGDTGNNNLSKRNTP